MNSGLHIGWATYNINEGENWTEKELTPFVVIFVHCCWFIGMIIGVLIGIYFIDKVGRRQSQIGALVFFLSNGMLLTGFQKYPGMIVCGELIGGIGAGIIYLTYYVKAGEISCRVIRGETAAWGAFSTMFGLWIFSFFTFYVGHKAPLVFIGIVSIIDTLIATFFVMTATLESPAFLITQDKDDEARSMLYCLRIYIEEDKKNFIEKPLKSDDVEMNMDDEENKNDEFFIQTDRLMQDLLAYVRYEGNEKMLYKRNIKKLLIIIVARTLSVISYNLPINVLLMGLFYANTDIIWMYPLLYFIRLFGCLIGLLTVDIIGRKILIAISGIPSFLILIALTIILQTLNKAESTNWPPSFLFLLLQLFSGVGSIISYVLSTELYPFKIKCKFNGIALIFELLLSLFILLSWTNHMYDLNNDTVLVTLYVYSSIILLGTFVLLILLKETKLLTLNECVLKIK